VETKVELTAAFVALLIFLASFGISTKVSIAQESSLLAMPEEYVNYNITRVDGVLWAKIDGTYPILYTGSEGSILMVYPTPPGTTNISVTLDNIELDWNNFTEVSPDDRHHTAIGDWQMISTVLEPFSGYFAVRGYFVLRIHYEHPVQMINGSYVFLYDLNIKEYLSDSANKSVAHFTILMETEYTDLKVNTVFGEEEALNPIEFTVSDEKPVEIRVNEVSEFGKPLPGDLLVSFKEANAQEPISIVWVAVSVLVIGFILAGIGFYGFRRRGKRAVV
jgi:hypothetical protein